MNNLTLLDDMHPLVQPLFERVFKDSLLLLLAMYQKDGTSVSDLAGPLQKLLLICMGRKAVDGVDLGSHHDTLAIDIDIFRSLDDLAPKRPFGLIPHEDDAVFGIPDAVFEVVQDPPTVTHPTASDDDVAAFLVVDALGGVGSGGEVQLREVEGVGLMLAIFREEIFVLFIHPGSLDPHRRVEIDFGVGWKLIIFAHLLEDTQKLLGALYGKRWDEDVAASFECLYDSIFELLHTLFVPLVESIAVGALDKEIVCIGRVCRRRVEVDLSVAQISTENYPFM